MASNDICGALTLDGTACTHPINPHTQRCAAGHTPQNRAVAPAKNLATVGAGAADLQGTVDFDDVVEPATVASLPDVPDPTAPWPANINPEATGRYYRPSQEFLQAKAETEDEYRKMDFRDLEKECLRVEDQWQDLWARKKVGYENRSDYDYQVLDAEEAELKARREILADALFRTPNAVNIEEQHRLKQASEKRQWIEFCTEFDKLSDEELAQRIESETKSYEADMDNEKYRDGPMTSGALHMYTKRSENIANLKRYQKQRAQEAELSVKDLFARRNEAETMSRFVAEVSKKTVVPEEVAPVAKSRDDSVGRSLDMGRAEYRRAMETRIKADRESVSASRAEAQRYQQLIADRD